MKRQERHELKHDKFVETLLAIGNWLQEHQRPIVVGVVIVAIVAGVVVWSGMSSEAAREDRRTRLYAARQEIYQALGSQGQDPDTRTDALTRGLTSLRRVYESAPKSPAGREALYLIAEVQFNEKNFPKAIAAYRDLLAGPGATPKLRKLVRASLAVALEETDDWRAAADVHRERVQELDGELKAAALLSLARCQEQLGELKEAEETRRRAAAAAPETVWAERAQLDIRLAEAPRPVREAPAETPAEDTEAPAETPAEEDTEAPAEDAAEAPDTPAPDAAPAPDTAPGAETKGDTPAE